MKSKTPYLVAAVVLGSAVLAPVAWSVVPKEGQSLQSKLATEALLLDVERAGTRLVAVGEYGNILLSDDEGKTWRQAHVPTTVTLTDVDFIDDKTGWAVGHDTVIVKTTDGGENWVKEFGGGESDNALLTVHFKDASHGWAMGAFNFTVETVDGGKTWTQRNTLMPPGTAPINQAPDPTAALTGPKDPNEAAGAAPAAPVPAPSAAPGGGADPYAAATGDENHLNAMFAGPDADTLLIAAEAGAIYRSTDGGVTWSKILTGYAGSFWGGLTAKDGTSYVVGMRGNIWQSKDKGATWSKLDTSGADQSISGGVQLADGSLVFVGLGGQVLYSPDGQKFTLTYRPDRKALNAVIQDGDHLLVFGEAGVQTQSSTPKPEEIDVPLPPADAAESGG